MKALSFYLFQLIQKLGTLLFGKELNPYKTWADVLDNLIWIFGGVVFYLIYCTIVPLFN